MGSVRSRAFAAASAATLAATAALALPAAALAQAATAEPTAAVDAVVVTGSRIVRDGFSAPTPTTVYSQEDIYLSAKPNIADVVNDLPQLQGSLTPTTNNSAISVGAGGANIFNLRQLGPQRTLVLLDGRRVVPMTGTGTTDANNLPGQLVQRVDIVTGGASAAYGSDAVAGVINFVIDKNFQGLKGSFEGGISSRGDGAQRGGELSYGARFAGGRGHLLLSGDFQKADEIEGLDRSKRSWYRGIRYVNNPAFVSRTATPNVPALITFENVNWALAAPGGLITAGPLKGTQFGPGGVVLPFVYGSVIAGQSMAGGQRGDTIDEIALAQAVTNANLFGRVTYDFSPNLSGFLQFIAGYSRGQETASANVRFFGNLTMNRANPYIPASVVAALTNAGATTFSYGVNSADTGKYRQDNIRDTRQFTGGLNGKLFGSWTWDAYYQYGQSKLKNQVENNIDNAKFANAIDVITGPSGQPVCRSFATNPGCVPLNIFGTGVATPQALAYVSGTSETHINFVQQVAEASISGEPINLWAGPVSLVAGVGYRSEKIHTPYADPVSLAGGWSTANYQKTNGKYDVKEAFAETVIPLAKDAGWAKSLELNGAVRVTDYSTAGTVVTWKGGVNFRPIQDLLIRGTRSRDIRAPGLSDLYAAGGSNRSNGIFDPKYGNQVIAGFSNILSGNPNLRPEKSNALGIGAVYQPSWFSGFSASFDYYDIKIRDGVASAPVQTLVNDCFTGVHPEYCAFITRGPSLVGSTPVPDTVVQVVLAPVNLAAFRAKGYDIEASYRKNLSDWVSGWDATLFIRSLATHVISNSQDNGLGVIHETAGEVGGVNNTGGAARWRLNTQVTYTQGPLTLSGNWRYVTSAVVSTSFYDTSAGPLTVDNNNVPSVSYFDLGATYRFKIGSSNLEIYGRVNNLFDKDPPAVPINNLFRGQFNPVMYDLIGRYYRAGLRFRM